MKAEVDYEIKQKAVVVFVKNEYETGGKDCSTEQWESNKALRAALGEEFRGRMDWDPIFKAGVAGTGADAISDAKRLIKMATAAGAEPVRTAVKVLDFQGQDA